MKGVRAVFWTWLAGLSVALAANEPQSAQVTAERPAPPRAEPKAETCHRVETPRGSVSGIAVAVVQADNKLQLLNPAAPPEYGSPEDAVVRDPISGKVSGLKILAIEF